MKVGKKVPFVLFWRGALAIENYPRGLVIISRFLIIHFVLVIQQSLSTSLKTITYIDTILQINSNQYLEDTLLVGSYKKAPKSLPL